MALENELTMTKEELWQAVLAQIQFNISPANFATWFKNTGIYSKQGKEVIISVPNNFSKEWLENKYNKLIFKVLHNLDEEINEVKYQVIHSEQKIKNKLPNLPKEEQLEFQELKVDKETNLNPRYLFENFVVGPFNEIPQAAGWAVVKNPGNVYNPLFFYGGVGLGKTHLLQAIGNEIVKNFSQKEIKYLPAERLISDIVTAIRNRQIENLKSMYRKINVLIIDDIQFIAGKEKTQEEFFHIFNTLYENNNQIILSSDRPPKAISSLEERLRSRFEGGMIADIGFPDFETRMAILKEKISEKGIDFPDQILEYIASNIHKNIRELEGALHRLTVYQKLNNQTPSLEVAKTLLKNIIFSPQTLTSKKIIQAVADFYDLKEKDLLESSRKREIVYPRQIVMYLLKEELKYSFPSIGRKFGGKDHTTALHSYNKIVKEIQTNTNLAEEIEVIKQRALSY